VNPVALAGSRTMVIFLFFLVFSTLTGRLETNIPSMVYVYVFLASITGVFLNSILTYKSFELIKISNSIAITTIGPFFTAAYSLIFLSLIPTYSQLFGGSLIVFGIIMISLTRKSPKI
jgi:drug/metabolite transporter (DMT)-like permease